MMLAALLVLASAFAPGAATEPVAIDPATEPVAIDMRAETLVRGTRIEVRDVIEPASAAALTDELLATDLGRAPSPGYARAISPDAVKLVLAGTPVTIGGAVECVVRTDTVTIGSAELLAAAEAFLLKEGRPPASARIEVERTAYDTQVPRGRTGRELRPRFHGNVTARGSVTIDVDVLVDGKLQNVVPLTLLVRTFAEIQVLAEDLAKGQALEPHLLRRDRVETTRMQTVAQTDARSLFGQLALRPLAAGTVPAARDFAAPVIVRKNDSVTLVFSSGLLRAQAFGIAKNAGALGDTIQVENQTTKRILVGRIAGPGLVQLNP